MKTETIRNLSVFSLLVTIGVAARFAFLDLPNFTATAAVAVFAGFYFTKRSWAILAPLTVMVMSNIWLDAYNSWGELVVVYAAMVFPVALSRSLRVQRGERRRMNPVGMGACAVIPSLVFFVSTNFAVWLFNAHYTADLAGLTQCFASALPFYRFTLAGDVLFVFAAFASYELAVRLAVPTQRAAVAKS